jgi:GDP-4-dehydro-6-deoxy-D-mannose reductase
MKALIFGVNGFAGRYLAQEFLNAGYQVYGSDIQRIPVPLQNVQFKMLDFMDSEAVFQLVSEVEPDMIVNLAAVSSVGMSWELPQKTMMINVVGALNILEAAKRQSIMSKVLLIGSSEQYQSSGVPINEQTPLDYNNPYGISKVAQEQFAKLYRKQYGLKVYCVRPFNHTGVGQKESFVLASFCKQAAEIERSGKTGVIWTGNLAVERDFCHVKDVVRAYRMILEDGNPDTVYNIGSGKAYWLEKLLKYIISLCKQEIKIEIMPERIRPADTPTVCCDYSLLKQELGWKPEYTVFDALKEMFNHFLESSL